MGHIGASSLAGISGRAATTAASPALPKDRVEDRALRLAVTSAVRTLNESGYAGDGREVTYSIDPGSKKPVVRVIESETKETIAQWPAEYALALAAERSQTRDSG